MSTKLSAAQASAAAFIQQCRMAPSIPTAWLPVSYVMAHCEIESGFDPSIKASDFATTGSEGLMQVESATAQQVAAQWGHLVDLTKLQTDAYTSICTGMLYLYTCKQYLLPIFGSPLLYKHVCMAYNEGPGNAGKGIVDSAYYLKWLSAQQQFAFLDLSPPLIT